MRRISLSRPVSLALEDGLLSKDRSFFDYGCGRGGDLKRLQALEQLDRVLRDNNQPFSQIVQCVEEGTRAWTLTLAPWRSKRGHLQL